MCFLLLFFLPCAIVSNTYYIHNVTNKAGIVSVELFPNKGKNKNDQLPHILEVDIKYDNDENIIETEGSKIKMEEVLETKYLEFVLVICPIFQIKSRNI